MRTTPRRSKAPANAKAHGGDPGAAALRGAPRGCCVGAGEVSARAGDGVGPGAHAAGVDPGIKAANLKHLKRIEGQVRGIAAMIEEDRYCADIIQQCAAVRESLRSVARNLYRNHLTHCATRAMREDGAAWGGGEMIDELVALVDKIAR